MTNTYDAFSFLAGTLERYDWSNEHLNNSHQVNVVAVTNRWRRHHDRGWFYYLLEKNIDKAKQEFYTCGLLDEAINRLVGQKTARDMGQSHWNASSLDQMSHFVDALLCDNKALIDRRVKLSYPEHEQYVFKDKLEQSIIIDLLFSLCRSDTKRVEQLNSVLSTSHKAKDFAFDRLYVEGLLEGNSAKMQEGIEGVASAKIHKRRQTQDESKLFFTWDNVVLSHYGIVYTKVAWMLGYELDIQAPLVRVTKDLWPVKPLSTYDSVYGFLQPE